MTVFAGIIFTDDHSHLDLQKEMKVNFSRLIGCNHSAEYTTERSFFIAYDANSNTGAKEVVNDSANFGWLSGESFIRNDDNTYASDEVSYILDYFLRNNLSSCLKRARGVFSGVCVNREQNQYSVFTDKLGIRPVYIYQSDKFIIVSSVLSLIKSLNSIDLSYDVDDVAIFAGLGFCLGNRTPYKNITRLEAGSIAQFKSISGTIQAKFYSYWSYSKDVTTKSETTDADIVELYEIFKEAVFIRNKNQKSAISFLSGGMDSRTVTAMVNQFVDTQTTYNYSKNNSQDQIFARDYAKNAKLQHNEQSFKQLEYPNWSSLISKSIIQNNPSLSNNSYKRVWSGDGGSVGLGMVYITKNLEEALLNEQFDTGIVHLMKTFGASVPFTFIKNDFITESKDFLLNHVRKHIQINSDDPVKGIYNFLLYNDQKRHMDQHYETICEHGVEMMLPFFDSEFLSKIYSLPSKDLIYHRAYAKWFNLFPSYVTETAWQTYPEHIECPIKVDLSLGYQWAGSVNTWSSRLQDTRKFLKIKYNSPVFNVFSRLKIYTALVLHILGIQNYSYILKKLIKLDCN